MKYTTDMLRSLLSWNLLLVDGRQTQTNNGSVKKIILDSEKCYKGSKAGPRDSVRGALPLRLVGKEELREKVPLELILELETEPVA